MEACPCGSTVSYNQCCRPLIHGERQAATAEQLMRSRYSAYVKKELGYIFTSLHPDHRTGYDENSTRAWAESAEWHGITIINTKNGKERDTEGQVEFTVSFSEKGTKQEHHELSDFKKENGTWYFTTGKTVPRSVFRTAPKIGRNEPCACGSGKKFKKCCG